MEVAGKPRRKARRVAHLHLAVHCRARREETPGCTARGAADGAVGRTDRVGPRTTAGARRTGHSTHIILTTPLLKKSALRVGRINVVRAGDMSYLDYSIVKKFSYFSVVLFSYLYKRTRQDSCTSIVPVACSRHAYPRTV